VISPAAPPLVELDTTTSTQEQARALLGTGARHGTVVVARTQTSGRGRRGRAWVSGPHGLWLSVVLRPDPLPMAKALRLPLAAAAVIVEVLDAHGVEVFVKWPNDLLVGDARAAGVLGPYRKAGGLLLEAVDVATSDGTARLRTAVLGLGLNLRPPVGGFPDEIAATAGTLWPALQAGEATAADDERRALAVALGAALAARLPGDADDDDAFDRVRTRLRQRSATLGRRVRVDDVEGVAVDLDDDGALVVVDDAGVRRIVRAGDVAVLP
jgi:BirA family biotin operon repressor/biotin-[acetyl-CoA-carboxylase] ligase